MTTQNDHLNAAVKARSNFHARLSEVTTVAIQELAALAIKDMNWQVETRGCSEVTAYREADENMQKQIKDTIADGVRNALQSALIEQRKARRG